jgi:hypothetical protein
MKTLYKLNAWLTPGRMFVIILLILALLKKLR